MVPFLKDYLFFSEPFFSIDQPHCLVETFLACFFSHFQFLTQSDEFAKAIAFAWCPFLQIYQMVSFFEYYLFFSSLFLHRTTAKFCLNAFCMFFFSIFNF